MVGEAVKRKRRRRSMFHPYEQMIQPVKPIPDLWRKTLDEKYCVSRDNLKMDKLIEAMTLTEETKKEFNDMVDNHQRTDHLIKRVLPNGSKALMQELKKGLKASGQEKLISFTPGKTVKEPKVENSVSPMDKQPHRGLKRTISVDGGLKNICNVPADDFPVMIHVNGPKYLQLMQRHDKPMLNLRKYITDIHGKLHPTKKGILLTLEDWQALVKVDIGTLMHQKRNA